VTISGQAVTLFSMVFCGFLMGFLYDTYRIFERMYKMKKWLIWICDLLFWISATFLVFGTLLRVNEGIVRIYIFLGLGIGTIIYLLSFRVLYGKILKKMIQIILIIYGTLVKIIQVLLIAPVVSLFLFVVKMVKWLIKILTTLSKWIGIPLIKLGKFLGKWIKKGTTLLYQKMVKTLTKLLKRKKI
jgi:spore cortex biosynthesis protein YabQ